MNMGEIENMPAPELPKVGYPDRRGLGDFRTEFSMGRVSFFKHVKCANCNRPLPLGFVFCDALCHKALLAKTTTDKEGEATTK